MFFVRFPSRGEVSPAPDATDAFADALPLFNAPNRFLGSEIHRSLFTPGLALVHANTLIVCITVWLSVNGGNILTAGWPAVRIFRTELQTAIFVSRTLNVNS